MEMLVTSCYDSPMGKGRLLAKIVQIVLAVSFWGMIAGALIGAFSAGFGKGLLGLGIVSVVLYWLNNQKNKIDVLKTVEPGYNDWEDEEIEKQLKAIEECGYKWFEQNGMVGFKHTQTGLYLKMEGLHFYKPEEIKRVYKEVWSKDDPNQVKKREATAQKLVEAISKGATDEEIESIFQEH